MSTRQILPRRLEVVIEKLDLAKESFEPDSPEYRLLSDIQLQIKALIYQYKATK